jgi:hypothetical protein
VAFHFEEAREQYLELPLWYSLVYENVDDHASLAESEVNSAAVFCSCVVVAAEAMEFRFIGVEALPVAICTAGVVH